MKIKAALWKTAIISRRHLEAHADAQLLAVGAVSYCSVFVPRHTQSPQCAHKHLLLLLGLGRGGLLASQSSLTICCCRRYCRTDDGGIWVEVMCASAIYTQMTSASTNSWAHGEDRKLPVFKPPSCHSKQQIQHRFSMQTVSRVSFSHLSNKPTVYCIMLVLSCNIIWWAGWLGTHKKARCG